MDLTDKVTSNTAGARVRYTCEINPKNLQIKERQEERSEEKQDKQRKCWKNKDNDSKRKKVTFFVLLPHAGKGHVSDVGCFQSNSEAREKIQARSECEILEDAGSSLSLLRPFWVFFHEAQRALCMSPRRSRSRHHAVTVPHHTKSHKANICLGSHSAAEHSKTCLNR